MSHDDHAVLVNRANKGGQKEENILSQHSQFCLKGDFVHKYHMAITSVWTNLSRPLLRAILPTTVGSGARAMTENRKGKGPVSTVSFHYLRTLHYMAQSSY